MKELTSRLIGTAKVSTVSEHPGSQLAYDCPRREAFAALLHAITNQTKIDLQAWQLLSTFTLVCKKRLFTLDSTIGKLALKEKDEGGLSQVLAKKAEFQAEKDAILADFGRRFSAFIAESRSEAHLFQMLQILKDAGRFVPITLSSIYAASLTNCKLALEIYRASACTVFDEVKAAPNGEYDASLDAYKNAELSSMRSYIATAHTVDFGRLLEEIEEKFKGFESPDGVMGDYEAILKHVLFASACERRIPASPEALLETILLGRDFIKRHQCVYINIITDEQSAAALENAEENEQDVDTDRLNQLLWLFEMLFVKQFIRNAPAKALLERFLMEFILVVLHTHCSQLIQQELVRLTKEQRDKSPEYMAQLRAFFSGLPGFVGVHGVSARRAGAIPELFATAFESGAFEDAFYAELKGNVMLRDEMDRLETIQKLHILRVLTRQNFLETDELHAVLAKVLRLVGNADYCVRNGCMLLFGALAQQLAIRNAKKLYSISSISQDLLAAIQEALESGNKYRTLLAVEFASYLHPKQVSLDKEETQQRIHSQIVCLLKTEGKDRNGEEITSQTLFSRSDVSLDSPYLLYVAARALIAFYGIGVTGIEALVNARLDLPTRYFVFLIRLQMRPWEQWKQGRGHGLLEEQEIDFRFLAGHNELFGTLLGLDSKLDEEIRQVMAFK